MDIRHPLKDSDRAFADYCLSLAPNLEIIYVLTKADKLTKNEQNKAVFFLKSFMNNSNIWVISSLNGFGIESLRIKLLKFM